MSKHETASRLRNVSLHADGDFTYCGAGRGRQIMVPSCRPHDGALFDVLLNHNFSIVAAVAVIIVAVATPDTAAAASTSGAWRSGSRNKSNHSG